MLLKEDFLAGTSRLAGAGAVEWEGFDLKSSCGQFTVQESLCSWMDSIAKRGAKITEMRDARIEPGTSTTKHPFCCR